MIKSREAQNEIRECVCVCGAGFIVSIVAGYNPEGCQPGGHYSLIHHNPAPSPTPLPTPPRHPLAPLWVRVSTDLQIKIRVPGSCHLESRHRQDRQDRLPAPTGVPLGGFVVIPWPGALLPLILSEPDMCSRFQPIMHSLFNMTLPKGHTKPLELNRLTR